MKVGYVLSSGGALGASHLGVLKRLEEEKIKPNVIAGSSVGAVIGGFYASGRSINEMIDLSLTNEVKNTFSDYSIFGINRNGFGAIKGDRFLDLLKKKTSNKSFHDLQIPTAFNAVDLHTSEEIVLKEGNIAEAIRASSSIPILFKPFLKNGRHLIDGSVANPLPVHLAKELGSEFTIAISFKTEHCIEKEYTFAELKDVLLSKLDNPIFGSFKQVFSLPFIQPILNFLGLNQNLIKHCVEMHNVNKVKKSKQAADYLIETDLSYKQGVSTEDLIKLGYIKGGEIIDELHRKMESKRDILSKDTAVNKIIL